MRLLGLSDKTEDQIGRFGTGLKESIALLIRRGLKPIFFSGTCRIDFDVLEVDGQSEICFMLSKKQGSFTAKKWHGLGIHPNFGKHDWDDLWMVFRELMCNAVDASGVEDLHHTITSDEPKGKAGSTRIYFPANHEAIKAYTQCGDRLLMLNPVEPVFSHKDYGHILPKREEAGVQVYHRNVWVQQGPAAEPSLFDYELKNLKLNESRSSDWYNVRIRMAEILREADMRVTTMVLTAMMKTGISYFEDSLMRLVGWSITVENGTNWCNAFYNIFGDEAVLTRNEKIYVERLLAKKKTPVICENVELYSMLVKAGVKDAIGLLTDEEKHPTNHTIPSEESMKMYAGIWKTLRDVGIAKMHPPKFMLFSEVSPSGRLGFTNGSTCYINESICGSASERIAVIQEICHYICNYHSSEYNTFLLYVIGELL